MAAKATANAAAGATRRTKRWLGYNNSPLPPAPKYRLGSAAARAAHEEEVAQFKRKPAQLSATAALAKERAQDDREEREVPANEKQRLDAAAAERAASVAAANRRVAARRAREDRGDRAGVAFSIAGPSAEEAEAARVAEEERNAEAARAAEEERAMARRTEPEKYRGGGRRSFTVKHRGGKSLAYYLGLSQNAKNERKAIYYH
jgi:hypothetical protein